MRRYFVFVLIGTWLLSPGVGTAQTPSREKALADFYWRTGHYQSALFYLQLEEKREKKEPDKLQKEIDKRLEQLAEEREAKKKADDKAGSLETLIAAALKNNPDIRVAEAKVRETEAEVSRTRMKVTSDITTLSAEIHAAQAALEEAETRHLRALELAKRSSISREELAAAKQSCVKMKAEVAVKQAKMPYLLGKEVGGAPVVAEALKNNPDIHVAEAKVRETIAELSRTRMKVVSDLSFLHAELQAAQAGLDEGKQRYERMLKLYEHKAVAMEELSAAKLTLLQLTADQAAKQAKLPYLLGKPAGESASSALVDDLIKKKLLDSANDTKTSDEEFLRRAMLDVQGRLPTAKEMKEFSQIPARTAKERREKWLQHELGRIVSNRIPKQCLTGSAASCIKCHSHPEAPAQLQREWMEKYWQIYFKADTPMAEKLRMALDKPVTLKAENFKLKDVMEFIQEKHLKGVNVHVRANPSKKEAITIALGEPIPLGAFLQYLEDELECVFVLRDYGIVVTSSAERLPPGAIRVIDFWKHGKTAEKMPAEKEKSKASPAEKTKTELPQGVRGVIVKVDTKDSLLMELSIGSDAGLAKGSTLDVFRLQPEAKYLGRVEVVEVSAARSIARHVGHFMTPPALQPGDMVASNLK